MQIQAIAQRKRTINSNLWIGLVSWYHVDTGNSTEHIVSNENPAKAIAGKNMGVKNEVEQKLPKKFGPIGPKK